MNILFVVPGGNDLGGIITSTEQYILGLKEAGHDVSFATVGFNRTGTRASGNRLPRGKFADDFTMGPGTGVLMHPTQGWRGEPRWSLMHDGERQEFIKWAKMYDIIIWASMYGFRNPDTEGRTEWFEAIKKLKGKNVFFIHDDHLPERYPWAYALAPYARAMIGVQPCSYDSLQGVAAPRAMVYTPLAPLPRQINPVTMRKGFFMCQVWKGWKNGDKLIAAAPKIRNTRITFAGDGIQLRYIRSLEKCPPRWAGIWTRAMKRHSYAGVLQEAERDEYLRRQRFLVDLSLRHNSGQYNRICQEAMAQGCVVIADPRFITGTSEDPVFKPNVHYIPIYSDTDDIAKRLNEIYTSFPDERYTKMQREARKALAVFDRKKLGAEIVEFVERADRPDDEYSKTYLKIGKEFFNAIFGELK